MSFRVSEAARLATSMPAPHRGEEAMQSKP
jgi:hypothetical protein